jgi:Cys-rich four helix bundle protein (predicted Tat secretion target)
MLRRDLMLEAGALLIAGGALARAEAAEDPHAGHGAHGGHAGMEGPLLDEASDCVRVGEVCLDHCFHILATGDTSIAECGRSVNEMVAVSRALENLAAAGSPRLPGLARAAVATYEHCQAECKKHAPKHEICAKCGEACAVIIKAITALPAKA